MSAQPPRIAEHLLRYILRTPDRDYILGDLAEQYRQTAMTGGGQFRASLWYWKQVAQSIPPMWQRGRTIRTGKRKPLKHSSKGQGMESIRHDIRFTLRQLRRNTGFALTVIITLALGIGANTAIFSVVRSTLLQPLPYPDSEELVYLTSRLTRADIPATHVASPDFADIQGSVSGLDVAAISETVVLPLTVETRSETVVISRTSWNFFDVLGVPPVIGRTFNVADGYPVTQTDWRPLPLILSYGVWQTWFGGDAEIVGRSVRINGTPAEIIGVMPQSFAVHLPPVANIGSNIDVWWPSRVDYSTGPRDARFLRVIGRIDVATPPTQVSQALTALASRLRAEHSTHADVGQEFDMRGLHDGVVGPVRGTLIVFLGTVGFVLLISCANVTNLLMARGSARGSELAVRTALGADRGRIVQQVLTESAVLSVMGGAVGIALAGGGIRILEVLRPPDLPHIADISMDLRVLGFTMMATLLATVLYGIAPAIQYARLGTSRIAGDRTTTGSKRQRRIQATLAGGEVALAIVLLTGAALMVRSFRELQQVPLGFDTERLVTFRTNTLTACPWIDGSFQCTLRDIEREVERSVAELPGVISAGAVFPLPMNGVYDRIANYTPDALRDDKNARREAYFRTASPSYFETMGIELLAGRMMERADDDTTVAVVMVDQTLARSEWPDENPVGKRLAIFGWGFDRTDAYEVIGVVERVPQWDHRDQRPAIYLPRAFYRSIEVSMAVRTEGSPTNLASDIRRALSSVSPALPVEFVQMQDLVAASLAPTRFVLTLLTVFSGIALVLAATGLYGVLAFTVRQRTKEIGIRMAFGAMSANVVRDVMKRGLTIAGVGTLIGLGGALALGGFLEHHLFGVTSTDPISLLATVIVVLVVAALASYVPARRAASVDPLIALRTE